MAFSLIMTGLMIFSMFASVGSSAYKTQKESQTLRDQIQQVKNDSATLHAHYQKIINDIANLDVEATSELTDALDSVAQSTQQLQQIKLKYNQSFRRMEIICITIVLIIFFLFLLRQFNLLSPLWYILTLQFLFQKKAK